jgi:hypothetical protein
MHLSDEDLGFLEKMAYANNTTVEYEAHLAIKYFREVHPNIDEYVELAP